MFDTNPSPRPLIFTFWRTVLLLLVLAGGAGLIWLAGFEKRIEVTQAEAQAMLNEQVAKYLEKNPKDTIEYATLTFADNEMTIDAAGGRKMWTEKFGEFDVFASVSAVGDPDYRPRSVYFIPSDDANAFDLKDLALNGEDPLEIAKRTLATFATEAPVVRDTLRDNGKVQKGLDWLKDKAGVDVQLDETVNDAAIKAAEAAANDFVERYRVQAETFMEGLVQQLLSNTPLYTLGKDWKEQVAAAALTDIGIVDRKFTATISGWQLIKTVLFGLLIIGASIAFAVSIVRGGGVGLGAAIGSGLFSG